MTFVFGWYSFRLKTYSAEELQLNPEEWNNGTFEVRQKVAHIFWLPLFSIGKMYAVRKKGKLYDLPDSVINTIKNKGKVKTPWYSFFLPIALIVGFIVGGIVIYVGESMMRHNNESRDKEQYEASIKIVQKELATLRVNAYLRIVNTSQYESDDKAVLLKMVGKKDNTYKFLVFEAKIPKRETERYYLYQSKPDTLSFSKSDLQKAVCTEFDNFKERKNCGYPFMGNGNKYIIDAIDYFDGPIIDGPADWYFWDTVRDRDFHFTERFAGNQTERSWLITLDLQNFGIPADLVQIRNLEGNIKWLDSLPLHLNRYEYLKDIHLNGNITIKPREVKFKSVLTFKDSLNKNHEYILEGKESSYTIKRK